MIKVLKLLLRFFFEGNSQLQLREMLSLKKKKKNGKIFKETHKETYQT